MNPFAFAAILLLAFLTLACEKDPEKPRMKEIQLTSSQKSMVQAGNSFAFRLLRAVDGKEKEKDRYFISPYSAAEALSMTLNGAAGATLDSMKETLAYTDMSMEEVNAYCQTIRNSLLTLDNKVQLSIANSIWYRNGFEVLPQFVDVNATWYDAVVRELDFFSPDAKDIINSWIEHKTNGRIQNMIKAIDPATVMFLINALWFKGEWMSRFDESQTRLDYFTPASGEKLQVPMMGQTQVFGYYANQEVQLAELPFGQGNFAMYILLPAAGKSVDDLMLALDKESWGDWISRLENMNLGLRMPKLKFTYELTMNSVLESLGMGIAFGPDADFTGIRQSGGLYISEVRQNTFLEMNEKGAEAAAVTVVEIKETSAGPGSEVIPFIADHPFIFVLAERSTSAILFAGRINKPAF